MPRDVMPIWQDAALARQMNAGEMAPHLPQPDPFTETDISREMLDALAAQQDITDYLGDPRERKASSLISHGVPTILELAGARFGEAAGGPHGMITTTELGGDIPEGRFSDTAAAWYRGSLPRGQRPIEFKEEYGPEGAKKQYFPEIARHETMHSAVRELGESGALMEMSLPEMEDIYKTKVDRGLWSGIKPFSIDPRTGLPANYMPYEDMQQVAGWKKEQEEIRALMVTLPEWEEDRGLEEGAQRTRILDQLNRDAQQKVDALQEQIDAITPASMAEMRDPAWLRMQEYLKFIENFPEEMREQAMEEIPFEGTHWAEENWAWKTPAGDRWTVEDLYNLQQFQKRGSYDSSGKFIPPKPDKTTEEDPSSENIVAWINWKQFLAEQPPSKFGGTKENYAEVGLPTIEDWRGEIGMSNWPMSQGHFFTLQQDIDEGSISSGSQLNIDKAKRAPRGSFVRAIAETGITEEALRVMRAYLMDNDWDKEGQRDFQESLDWYMENIAQWTN